MSFLRSVAVLVGGTALGHGITAAALPVLSRLYTPADFSLLAVFAGLVSIISVVACLRFDVAVALPEEDEEALRLLALALGTALACSFVVLIAVLVAPSRIAHWLNQSGLQAYLWLLPVSVLLGGGYSALQMWFVREKAFALIAKSRVAQSTASASTQIASGALAVGPGGLLLGHTMNTGAACLFLGYRLLADHATRAAFKRLTWRELRLTFQRYDRFPKYSTFEALCNSAAIHLPVIMIAALAAPTEAGYLMLATYVMQAPMALVGAAVGQVYLAGAAHKHRQGQLGEFTAEVLGGLLKTGIGPLLAVGIVSPAIFGLIFGAGWERAGVLVAWMTPWFILQFLSTPISMGLHVTGHQRLAFALQLVGLALRAGMVWLAASLSPLHVSEWYAVSGFLFYLLYLLTILWRTGLDWKRFLESSRHAVPVCLGWIVLAAAMSLLVSTLRP
ncbi:lipopolysaccharide biosynthesis protein [Hydrogenophaga sp. IBVHS1]|uniref:lipopolysaccharide biosynthesis protein n=1 Tax=unclassified Hydrogenophaga TaxID=2610897 RepID=UPI000A2E8338|nr:oligosaccharide flippase family protein [Hydrogenophaga sp. IBVHS1]OSZ71683.1 polysaccharide biosynthesis protein [Hydrogenophaga sp. IBVHS1]